MLTYTIYAYYNMPILIHGKNEIKNQLPHMDSYLFIHMFIYIKLISIN